MLWSVMVRAFLVVAACALVHGRRPDLLAFASAPAWWGQGSLALSGALVGSASSVAEGRARTGNGRHGYGGGGASVAPQWALAGATRRAAGRSTGAAGRRAAPRMAADFYTTLGVPRGASEKDIKQAFRAKARLYHPDVNPDPSATEKFQELSRAYEVLSDPQMRQRYDQFGEAGLGGGGGGGPGGGGFEVDLGDIFETFFGGSGPGGRGSRRQTGPQRGADLRVDLELSFKTACFGGEENVRIRQQQQCDACSGTGVKPGAKVSTCRTCGGSGAVTQVQRTPLGNFQTQTTCPTCRGTGQEVEEYCGVCSGQGLVDKTKQVKVRVPCGVEEGNKLRVRGEGDAGVRGGPVGDLYCFLTVKPDPRFRRQGREIYSDVDVSYLDAILGTAPEDGGGEGSGGKGGGGVAVPTIDGVEVPLAVPAGTQPGTVLRIRGKGAPQLSNADKRGDHLVTVKVDIPKQLSSEEQDVLKQLKQLRKERLEKAKT